MKSDKVQISEHDIDEIFSKVSRVLYTQWISSENIAQREAIYAKQEVLHDIALEFKEHLMEQR